MERGVIMGLVIRLFKGGNRMTTIFDVANYFISRSDDENPMTPLKLQKLCYYAQAWSLVWDNENLFEEDFEAWVHGPANHMLYRKYKEISFIKHIDPDYNDNIFNEDSLETLDVVWNTYGDYSGKYLEQLTHIEEPWINARRDLHPGEKSNNVIAKESMKLFYSSLNNG